MRQEHRMGLKLWLGCACVLLGPAVICGQSGTLAPGSAPGLTQAPDGKKCKPKDTACRSASAAPSSGSIAPAAAAENPFPVEDSRYGGNADGSAAAPRPAPLPAPGAGSGLPALPTGNDADPPSESNKPMKMPRDGYSTGGSSSGSGGASDGGGTSSSRSNEDDDVAPTTAAADAPVKASKLKDLGSSGSTSVARAKLEETRFADDLRVGKFYLDDGNAQGAYLRYKDAVEHVPDDPDARFGLAEAATKLNKRDEAVLNYRETIKLDPEGDHDKASRSALKRLGVTAQ